MWSEEKIRAEIAKLSVEVKALYLVRDLYGLTSLAESGLLESVTRAKALQDVLEGA